MGRQRLVFRHNSRITPGLTMPLIPGESYTRDHIHEILGGEKVSYLPQKDGKIVCGCFSSDANPEAPYVILVGGDGEARSTQSIRRRRSWMHRRNRSRSSSKEPRTIGYTRATSRFSVSPVTGISLKKSSDRRGGQMSLWL